MDIMFATDKLRKEFVDQQRLIRAHGPARAKKIAQRLADLRSATTLSMIKCFPGNCHELRENRAGQLAVALDGPYRLIFEPANVPIPRLPDGGLDWTQVTAIRIIEVVDYHGE